jgi:CheY-like chemotaxis protein
VHEPIAAPRIATLAGMRVLVVFASPADRAEISALVRQWQLQPIEADSGDMAVALLDRARVEGQPIPVALIGNPIHGEDGFLLALRIKRDTRLAQTLLIMLTGQGRPGDAGRCRANGVTGYLPLPVSEADLSAALTAVTGATADGGETPTLVTRHSLRERRHGGALLLVNAIRAEQLLFSHFLADTDFAITVVASAEEAIRAAQTQRFDVVIFDAQLADMDGLALARELRKIDRLAGGSALLFALSADVTFKKHAVAAGIAAVLSRPISKAALMEALSKS